MNKNQHLNPKSHIVENMLSIISNNSEPLNKPINVIQCNAEIKLIASDNGAICPHCNAVLKNRITLNIHMKRCPNKTQNTFRDIIQKEFTMHPPPSLDL